MKPISGLRKKDSGRNSVGTHLIFRNIIFGLLFDKFFFIMTYSTTFYNKEKKNFL